MGRAQREGGLGDPVCLGARVCVKGSRVMDAPRRALCRKQQTGGPGWEDRLRQGQQGKPGRIEAAGRRRAPQCATVRALGRYLSTRAPLGTQR